MKSELAESILKVVMNKWDVNKLTEELKDLQIISEIKYDDYQQYTHGMRYVESLALWLRQFDDFKDRELAYKLVKTKLLYVSEEEMRQLVEFAFQIAMKKYLLEKTKEFCIDNSILDIKERECVYKCLMRMTLFLGLSDGAHTDFFRRQNPELSNEQVFVHYDFSKSKSIDMLEELKEDNLIKKFNNKRCILTPEFSTYFLIDDFSASGKSYIRYDGKEWRGKIPKFFKQLSEIEYKKENIEIHLILYLATKKSIEYIQKEAQAYFENNNVKITIDAIQIVEHLDLDNEIDIENLLIKNYEKYKKEINYNDKHFKKGGGKKPYRGFADCSLFLVIYHNTPNNSLPILWYSCVALTDALFPRVSRHKEA